MNKTQEALKMAVEALEDLDAGHPICTSDLLQACIEALAELALEQMAENAKELGLDYDEQETQKFFERGKEIAKWADKQNNQEPFGIWHEGKTENESDFFLYKDSGDVLEEGDIYLYTSPKDQSAEIAHYKAQINDLREAVENLIKVKGRHNTEIAFKRLEQALAKTPAQSLQEHDNEVIEMCAKACENIVTGDDAEFYTYAFAEAIRALKGKQNES